MWCASCLVSDFIVRSSGDQHGNVRTFPSNRERLTWWRARCVTNVSSFDTLEILILLIPSCSLHAYVFFLFLLILCITDLQTQVNERKNIETQRLDEKRRSSRIFRTVETGERLKKHGDAIFVQVQLHGNRARHVSKIESRRNGSSLVSRSANAVLPLTT